MKLKITQSDKPTHTDSATSVAWSNVDNVFSCGDDHKLYMWNLLNNETSKVVDLPEDVFPTGMQWPPKSSATSTGGARKSTELLLITSADGHFHLLGRGGRIEKSVQAHKGAILSGSWNMDGSEILTSGEDGCVRVWSRAGMNRATLAQCPSPVYCSAWGPDNQSVVHSNGQFLIIKPKSSSQKPIQWKGHDSVILSVAWSLHSALIVSGGEDCRYKVWDSYGRAVFSSGRHAHPICSIAWAPAGDLFSVGSFNALRLCDRFGWSHCLEKPAVGSIYSMQWSSDGTQFAGAGASGHIFLASVVERSVTWRTVEATLTSQQTVTVTEFTANTRDKLDLRDRIIKISMSEGYLLCMTPSQIHIYNTSNTNTPAICELRENNSVSLILQSKNHFILCGGFLITVWSYEGRQVANIKWPGMRPDMVNSLTGTMTTDVVAFIDQTDSKLIRLFDPSNGKNLPEIKLRNEAKQISIGHNDFPGVTERLLAIVDKNRDLYIGLVKKFGVQEVPRKLCTMVDTVAWQTETPLLAAIREGKLRVYYFPRIIYVDQTLLDFTWEDKDLGELGHSPEILKYESNRISIRRPDGVLIVGSASPFVSHVFTHIVLGKFIEARRICRYVNNKLLWGVTAGLAAWKQDLDLAEIAYAEIGHYDKVIFVQEIKEIKDDEAMRTAMLALLSGGVREAESILIQNGKTVTAIELNANCHQWNRALELALKNKLNVDKVIRGRKSFLKSIQMPETLQPFLDYYKQVQDAPYVKKTKKKVSANKKQLDSSDTTTINTEYDEDQLDSGFIEKENKLSAHRNSNYNGETEKLGKRSLNNGDENNMNDHEQEMKDFLRKKDFYEDDDLVEGF